MMIGRTSFLILSFTLIVPLATSQTYRSALVDKEGRLSITLKSGKTIHPSKQPDQVAFEEAKLSPDHTIVGWLVDYRNTGSPESPLAGALTLYEAGHVIRTFPTDKIFYSWRFRHNGKHVAFCTGPTHGGAAVCELHEINSGRTLASWYPLAGAAPAWTAGLRY